MNQVPEKPNLSMSGETKKSELLAEEDEEEGMVEEGAGPR